MSKDKLFDLAFEFAPHINRAVTVRKTALVGRQAYMDTYEAIAEFIQEKHSLFTAGKTSVKDQKLRTAKEVAAHKAKLFKDVNDSYKGSGSNLVKASHFIIITYDKRSAVFRPIYHRHYGNLKSGVHQAARDISAWLPIQRHTDFEWLVVSRFGGPHYCSKGEDMTDKDCARMLGYAIHRADSYNSPPKTNKALDKKGLLDTAGQAPAGYLALVRDGDKVKRIDYRHVSGIDANNRAVALREFKAICGEGKKYKVGAVTRNLGSVSVIATASAEEFEHFGHDVYQLWADYIQQQGHYKKVTHDEAEAGMLTVAERTRLRKAGLAKVDADIKDFKSE